MHVCRTLPATLACGAQPLWKRTVRPTCTSIRRCFTAASPVLRNASLSDASKLRGTMLWDNGLHENVKFTKKELVKEFKIELRDTRILDASFRHQVPLFLPRPSSIVVCLHDIRAVIQHNRTILFDSNFESNTEILPVLRSQLVKKGYGKEIRHLYEFPATADVHPIEAGTPIDHILPLSGGEFAVPPAVDDGQKNAPAKKKVDDRTLAEHALSERKSSRGSSKRFLDHIDEFEVSQQGVSEDGQSTRGSTLLSDIRSMYSDEEKQPFEFCILESLIRHAVTTQCHSELESVEPELTELLSSLHESVSQDKLHMLLPLKNRLSTLSEVTKDLHHALAEVLNSEEDMSEMYLTTKHVTGHKRRLDQHTEVELLFEYYYKDVEEVMSHLRNLNNTLQSTQDIININLDTNRNRILKLDLLLAVGTMSASLGSLFAALFGMNLLSRLEEHPMAFHYVTASIMGMSTTTFVLMYFYCRRHRLF